MRWLYKVYLSSHSHIRHVFLCVTTAESPSSTFATKDRIERICIIARATVEEDAID